MDLEKIGSQKKDDILMILSLYPKVILWLPVNSGKMPVYNILLRWERKNEDVRC